MKNNCNNCGHKRLYHLSNQIPSCAIMNCNCIQFNEQLTMIQKIACVLSKEDKED